MITEQIATDRVTRGMALFTRVELDSIDLDSLDIANPSQCVVGQVFRTSYYSHHAELEMANRGITIFGETGRAAGLDVFDRDEAELLTREWVRQIRVQRGVDLQAGEPVTE